MASSDRVHHIPEDERRDILVEIDQRTVLAPRSAPFEPRRRGVVFPVLVNLVSVALVVAGITLTARFYDRRQLSLELERDAFVTAENAIIDEIRRESEARLAAKEGEITSVREEIRRLDAERQALKRSLQTAVAERERELRRELTADLAAERTRLSSAGRSDSQIRSALNALEARRRSRIETQLEEIRREAEQEIARREASIASAQTEMQRRLEEAQAERRELVADAAAREVALRGELSELEIERRRETLAMTRLLESYRELEALIEVGRADEATEAIDDIRSTVLTGPDSRLPAVAERRAVELFVLDSLESLVTLRFENTTDTELQQALAASRSDLRDAQERVQTLEAEVLRTQALSRQLSQSQAREREVRAQLERTESELRTALAELSEAETGRAERAEEVRRLMSALESSRANAERLSRALSSLRSDNARLERELSASNVAPADTDQRSVESTDLDAARKAIHSALATTTETELPLATAREEAAATADALAEAVVSDLRLVLAQSERLSVVTTQEVRLVGTVVSVGERTLALEPFAASTVDPGDSLWIRRRSGDSEINVGQAVVSAIGDGRIEANLTDTVTTPLVLDLVYVEAP